MHRIIHGHVPGAARGLQGLWDKLHFNVRKPLGLVGPALILPYRKYGTADRLRIGGRVIEDRGVLSASYTNSAAANIWLSLKRYGAYEMPGAAVRVRFGEDTETITADAKGFFEIEIEPAAPIHPPEGSLWLSVKLELVSTPSSASLPIEAEAQTLIPRLPRASEIISDIDDTIVKTGATNS
jgi:phosphatidate phosphatase APP1